MNAMLKPFFGVFVIAAAGLAFAPNASADTDDAAFLQQVGAAGVIYTDQAWMDGEGHAICGDLDHGAPVPSEAAALQSINANHGGSLTMEQAGLVVVLAQHYLCPASYVPSYTVPPMQAPNAPDDTLCAFSHTCSYEPKYNGQAPNE